MKMRAWSNIREANIASMVKTWSKKNIVMLTGLSQSLLGLVFIFLDGGGDVELIIHGIDLSTSIEKLSSDVLVSLEGVL